MLCIEATRARGPMGGNLLDKRCGCRGDQVPNLGERYRSRPQQQSRDDRGRGEEADAGKVRMDFPVRTVLNSHVGDVAGTIAPCVSISNDIGCAALAADTLEVDTTRRPDSASIN